MRCSFCLAEHGEVWPTTTGKRCCEACLTRAKFSACCQCEIFVENGDGQWWDDGLAYCFPCSRKVPRCMWCDRPAFERSPAGDKVICVYCQDHFPRCDHCAALIHGDCITFLRKVYCRSCANRHPLCLDCGTAIAHRPDCPNCQGPARACGGCNTLFADRWMVHDSTWYCLSCFWVACGRCRFCQELKPPDGDTRCQTCLQKRVQSMAVAQDLLDEVQWFCQEELGLAVRQPYQLRLADTAADIPKLHTDAYTLSLATVGLWVPRERMMWAVKGYPFWFTSAVLAHEHAHAWQQENCPRQSQDLLEGFAAWVEWRVVKNLGYATFADNMFKLQCPIYGRGLRRCLQLEQQVGAHGLLEKVRQLRKFPLWTSFWAFLDEV
ncbi:hypothetical protein IV102_12275 [bacterium]|nr:hypothetical protein [bacterium]